MCRHWAWTSSSFWKTVVETGWTSTLKRQVASVSTHLVLAPSAASYMENCPIQGCSAFSGPSLEFVLMLFHVRVRGNMKAVKGQRVPYLQWLTDQFRLHL